MESVGEYPRPRRVQNKKAQGGGGSGKVLPLALAAVGTIAAGRGIANDIGRSISGESQDNGVSVTFLPQEPQTPQENKTIEVENVQTSQGLFEKVFGNLDEAQKAQARQEVDMFKDRIAAKPGFFQEHMAIPLKYQKSMEEAAKAYGISREAISGIGSVENGGGEDVTNKISGARGIMQFLPDAGVENGLIINPEISVDQRANPEKSIAAAGRYLEKNKALFGGNEGLAIWSYHAGAGVVFEALRVYFLDVKHIDIGDYVAAIENKDPIARANVERMAKEQIGKGDFNIYKLFKNKAVQDKVLSRLHDYSDTYLDQVIAASELLKDQANQVRELPGGLKIAVANAPSTSPR